MIVSIFHLYYGNQTLSTNHVGVLGGMQESEAKAKAIAIAIAIATDKAIATTRAKAPPDPFQLFREKQKQVDLMLKKRTDWESEGQSKTECESSSRLKKISKEAMPFSKPSKACPFECEPREMITTKFDMENGGCSQGSEDVICGNTRRNSDVHVQYYSWEDIDFMKPIPPHAEYANKTIFMSSFVSNCGPQDRLDKLRELQIQIERLNQNPKLRVRNYGSCAHKNADQEADLRSFYSSTEANNIIAQGRDKIKDFLAQKSLFVFSYENSETEDYVTEKLFNMLSSSTIPVYRGATNARVYAPSMQSVVFANDYANAEELAGAMVRIASSEQNYNAYFEWKTTAKPDLKWIALMDESLVHSQCRACILIMDSFNHNHNHNHNYNYNYNQSFSQNKSNKRWWIRERGTLDFVGFESISEAFTKEGQWDLLRFEIADAFASTPEKRNGSGAVIQMYEAFDRNQCLQFNSIEDMQKLPIEGGFLEVVLENPGWAHRTRDI